MNQTVEKERLRRRKQNQRRARTKRFFMVLGVLVVALAAFLITVKICKPDFDFSLLVPDKAVTFVQENVLGHTTTAPTTQAPTAPPTTEKPTYADYKDASAFAFDTSKQGSQRRGAHRVDHRQSRSQEIPIVELQPMKTCSGRE